MGCSSMMRGAHRRAADGGMSASVDHRRGCSGCRPSSFETLKSFFPPVPQEESTDGGGHRDGDCRMLDFIQ